MAKGKGYLHEMTFYDGIIDVEMLEKEMEKVKEYVSDVDKTLKLTSKKALLQ